MHTWNIHTYVETKTTNGPRHAKNIYTAVYIYIFQQENAPPLPHRDFFIAPPFPPLTSSWRSSLPSFAAKARSTSTTPIPLFILPPLVLYSSTSSSHASWGGMPSYCFGLKQETKKKGHNHTNTQLHNYTTKQLHTHTHKHKHRSTHTHPSTRINAKRRRLQRIYDTHMCHRKKSYPTYSYHTSITHRKKKRKSRVHFFSVFLPG